MSKRDVINIISGVLGAAAFFGFDGETRRTPALHGPFRGKANPAKLAKIKRMKRGRRNRVVTQEDGAK